MWALASIQYLTGTLCPSTMGDLGKGHCLLKQEVMEAAFLPRKSYSDHPFGLHRNSCCDGEHTGVGKGKEEAKRQRQALRTSNTPHWP